MELRWSVFFIEILPPPVSDMPTLCWPGFKTSNEKSNGNSPQLGAVLNSLRSLLSFRRVFFYQKMAFFWKMRLYIMFCHFHSLLQNVWRFNGNLRLFMIQDFVFDAIFTYWCIDFIRLWKRAVSIKCCWFWIEIYIYNVDTPL